MFFNFVEKNFFLLHYVHTYYSNSYQIPNEEERYEKKFMSNMIEASPTNRLINLIS